MAESAPTNITEATSLVSFALECMSLEDYPPATSFPALSRIDVNPTMGFIEVTLPDGAGIEIQVTFFEAARKPSPASGTRRG